MAIYSYNVKFIYSHLLIEQPCKSYVYPPIVVEYLAKGLQYRLGVFDISSQGWAAATAIRAVMTRSATLIAISSFSRTIRS